MAETLGRYTLLRRVAAGGMAEIWKAKVLGPAGFQKTVAIKRILQHLVEETEFIQMFIEEAKLAAELVHPNVIQVFDFGQLGPNDYFIAMEYVAGPSLARLVKRAQERNTPFPASAALYVVGEAAKGLGHAHSKADETGVPLNIVHRDVSPQNILISYAGEVKVGDFGIAKAAGAVTRTLEGQVRGKLSYMSPEQANARKNLDGRSDLFSLGIVLYELLSGQKLFPSSLTTAEAYGRVAGYRGIELEELAAVPAPLREVVAKALAADPASRFQTGAELDAALNALLGPQGATRAREQLASLVQALFDEERRFEQTPTSIPLTPDAAASPASMIVGSVAQERVVSETIKSPTHLSGVGAASLRPPATPAVSSTGLTLASSKIAVTSTEAPPPPAAGRGISPAMVGAMAGSVALLALAGGLAVRIAGSGGAPAATPVPTPTPAPVAMASAAPTPAAVDGTELPAVSSGLSKTPRPIVTPAPASTPAPVATAPAPPQPTPARVAVAAGRMGTLSVTSRPWVQVWVDGKMVKPETPLTGHRLPSGPHKLRFINSGLDFDEVRTVTVPPDGELSVQIDVRKKSVTIR